MNGRRIAGLVAGWLLLTGLALGQDAERPRYRLPDTAVRTSDLEAFLKRRQAATEQNEQIKKLLDDLFDKRPGSEDMRRLQQLLQDNPDLRRQAEDNLRLQPNLGKALQDMLTQRQPGRQQVIDLAQRLTDRQPLLPNQPPIQPLPLPMPPQPGRPPEPVQPIQPPPRPPESLTDWAQRQTADWTKDLVKGNWNPLDDALVRGFVDSLRDNGMIPRRWEVPEWLKDATTSASSNFREWLPDLGPAPEMPRFVVGEWDFGAPELPSAASASRAGGFLLLLGIFGAAAWLILQTRGLRDFSGSATPARRLGPWPVSPDTVATRGEVVLAFEYLARKVLGLPAETSHHRAVARQLAARATSAQQARAADDLAALYEHARYTPPTESLSPEELARVRQALRLLATVNAA